MGIIPKNSRRARAVFAGATEVIATFRGWKPERSTPEIAENDLMANSFAKLWDDGQNRFHVSSGGDYYAITLPADTVI